MEISKEEFVKHEENMVHEINNIHEKLEKVDDSVGDLKVQMAAFPQQLFDKMDEKYARKEDVKTMKDDFKWLVRLVIGGVLITVGNVIYDIISQGWIK